LRVDIETGEIVNLTSGNSLAASPAPGFLLDMLRAGGLIAYLKSGGVLQQ
jgi:3-isopropylmalate/(R)-2-methylmalate dehydratase small subunit